MVEKDSFDHVVKTTAQWESQSFEYWIIPRGVLCVELTPDKKTKIKIGEGNKIYSQLPYINSETDLSDYYTKEEIDNILAMLNFVAIPSSEIYPTKEALPQTGNRQGDLRFVRNVGGDPYSYLWFNNKWIQVGGVDLSEYAKKSEVNPRLNALELKAHTHVNKSVLDRLTANVIDDSHRHVNKNILDATTAPYTTQDKSTLDALAAITVFEGATKTEDGTMGYVPAPLQGQQSYYLKGDGTWAYLNPGDKYKAGEGIFILSGEVTSDKFPFEIFPKAATVTQYVIYGTASGVGNLVSGKYEIPIKVSAPGYSDRIQTITVNDPLYDGDYIDYQKQVFAHYRTKISNQIEQDPNYSYERAIYSDGRIAYFSPGSYGGSPVVSKPFELTPGATYELHPWDYSGNQYSRFHDGMHINIYDADMNRTRTLYQEHLGNTVIVVADGEKYMRMTMQERNQPLGRYGYQDLYMLYPIETPCQLQQLTLYPGVVNTIDVLTTNKPNEIYVEVVPPEEPDPSDPSSEYTGIIYNDGVLDITQEDPNALNELTVHFRDDVEKTLTIPTYELPIATDSTLGAIIVGANLTIDENGVLDGKSGDKYKAGEGITILSGEVIADTFPFEIFPKADVVTQYVIYGTQNGVGEYVTDHYEVPIKVSAPGYADRTQTISIADPLYDGDFIDYERQVFSHYRTDVSAGYTTDPNYNYKMAIYSDGRIAYIDPGAFGASPTVTVPVAIEPGAKYELEPWIYDVRFNPGMHLNLYDSNMVLTRTIYQEYQGNTIITPNDGEAYMRLTIQSGVSLLDSRRHIYRLLSVETPCVLNQLLLYPNVINTIDVLTTNKPNEIYVKVEPDEDEPIDPDDPLSEYTGIIYNDGVLDVTQEDPNALNELTFHFRDDVDKTITIPTAELPIASDTTLGGIKVGENLTIDPVTGVLDATGKVYYPGNGIEFGGETALPTEFNARDFITSLNRIYRGTIVKADTMDAFTLTATGQDCYTESYFGYGFYSFTAEPNTKYRLSWTADSDLPGRTYAFESRGATIMYSVDNSVAKELVFTTTSTCNALAIRFGVQNTGDSIRYSNINVEKIIETADTIAAKLGNGLHFDANGAIEADGGGTEYAAGDGIQIDPGTSVIDITSIEWQQGKIDDSDGSEAISDVDPYLDCEMFEITSHTNMVTLSGTYTNDTMLLWKPYYYDENENYISTVNTWSTYEDGVQIPINAKYVRFVLTEDETTELDPNDLAHVEIEYPLEVGKEVITNAGVIDVQVRDRKLIIIKHDHIEEIPIPDPPLATTTIPGIVVVGDDLDIDENGVLNIADINRLILNAEE